MAFEFRLFSDVKGELLECPVWDDRRNSLFCCDIVGRAIFQVSFEGLLINQWQFDSEVASFGLCESGRLVVALAREVVIFDPETSQRTHLWSGYDELPTSRLNDGKVGPDGAFWVGGMDGRSEREPVSNLYRVTADGHAQIKVEGIKISNGLAWSQSGKTMYHSDSRAPWLDRYDFDSSTAVMSNRRRLIEFTEELGRPDGAAIDQEGFYWSAGVSAGVLNRIDPNGKIVETHKVPVPAPTMPCFVGPGLKQIIITSHSQTDVSNELSGRLFISNSPVAGVAVHRMRGV